MSLIATEIGIITLLFLVFSYFISARTFTLGGMSLPCMLLMTSVIYFFVMPALAFTNALPEFLGMYIDSLEWPHLAVGLYAVAGLAACYMKRELLTIDPAVPRPTDRPMDIRIWILLVVVASLSVVGLVALGLMSAFGAGTDDIVESADALRFLNLFLTMMVPLSVIFLVRSNFNLVSLAVLAAACLVLLVSGFRYRLIFMAFAVAAAFLLSRRIRPNTSFVLTGAFLGLLGTNFLVSARQRGEGLNLSRVEGMNWLDILHSFGGEIGPLFSFSNIANSPIREYFYLDPWAVGIARLIPSFIWRDKPTADYLYVALEGIPGNARAAGVAIPQHVEILLQFGWIGLPAIAFVYFWMALWLLARLSRLGAEARITAFALAPIFFGFYMPTRGYFFQALSDGLFTFGPLFALHIFKQSRRPKKQAMSPFDHRRPFKVQ